MNWKVRVLIKLSYH